MYNKKKMFIQELNIHVIGKFLNSLSSKMNLEMKKFYIFFDYHAS